MMQLVIAVFMIRVIIALIGDKNKEVKNDERVNDETVDVDARHPAGFQLR